MKHKKLSKLQYLILFFFVYSFIGWLMETAYAFHVYGHFVKRGFLYGPICPIYGYGAVLLIYVLDRYKNNSIKLFTYSAILFSVLEYVASYALEALFNLRWWDYTQEVLNLNGRISISFSFIWGISAILLINKIHPFIKLHTTKILKNIPYILQNILFYSIILVYFFDSILSSIKYIL